MRLSSFLPVVMVTLAATCPTTASAEDSAMIKRVPADSSRILSRVDDEERAFSLSGLKSLKSTFGKKWTKWTEALKKKATTPSEAYKKKVEKKMLRDNNNFIRR